MINELDQDALTRLVPGGQLVAGDVGTVVMVHENGKGFRTSSTSLQGNFILLGSSVIP